MLKQRGVGVRSALLQHQWAKLEADSGTLEDLYGACSERFCALHACNHVHDNM